MVTTEEIIEEAKSEINQGKAFDKPLLIRDGCEKAWLATKEIIDKLIKDRLGEVPKNNHSRRVALGKIEEKDQKLKDKGILDRFMAREKSLHESCFYDGQIENLDFIDSEIKKVEKLKEDLEGI